jgi:probable addiction module antidote protein
MGRDQEMPIKTARFDAAEHLGSDEAIAAFVDEVLRPENSADILSAFAVAIRAKGMNAIAEAAGLVPKVLYQDLRADSDVKLDAALRLIHALGLRLTVVPLPKRRSKAVRSKKGRSSG